MRPPVLATILATLLIAIAARAADVSSISPPAGTSGTTITVLGAGFGAKKGRAYLAPAGAGKRVKLSVKHWSDSQLVLRVPKKKKLPAGSLGLELKPKGTKKPQPTGKSFGVAPPAIYLTDTSAICLGFLAVEGSYLGPQPKWKFGKKKAKVFSQTPVFGAPPNDPVHRHVLRVSPSKKPSLSANLRVQTGAGKAEKQHLQSAVGVAPKGKLHLDVSGGGLSLATKSSFTSLDLAGKGLHIVGNDGQANVSILVKGFQPCSLTSYVLTGGAGAGVFKLQSGSVVVGTHGNAQDGVKVTITSRGDGRIEGTISGYATLTKPGQAPVPMPVSGSFRVEVTAAF